MKFSKENLIVCVSTSFCGLNLKGYIFNTLSGEITRWRSIHIFTIISMFFSVLDNEFVITEEKFLPIKLYLNVDLVIIYSDVFLKWCYSFVVLVNGH